MPKPKTTSIRIPTQLGAQLTTLEASLPWANTHQTLQLATWVGVQALAADPSLADQAAREIKAAIKADKSNA